jgi:hypothetical protein
MNGLDSLDFKMNPSYNMGVLLKYLTPSGIVPRANKYYTFIYKAKTRGIQYDQHPLVICGNVYQWGFNAMNVHWNGIRQYSWNEVISNVYELSDEEFEFLQNVPLAKFKNT